MIRRLLFWLFVDMLLLLGAFAEASVAITTESQGLQYLTAFLTVVFIAAFGAVAVVGWFDIIEN